MPDRGGKQGNDGMSSWVMGSKKYDDGTREVTIQFEHDDTTGRLSGWVRCMGKYFIVEGSWVAAGSVPGRAHSVCALMGSDQQAAPVLIAMTGTIDGSGSYPSEIQMNMIHVSSRNDQQRPWSGVLRPFPLGELPADAPAA